MVKKVSTWLLRYPITQIYRTKSNDYWDLPFASSNERAFTNILSSFFKYFVGFLSSE